MIPVPVPDNPTLQAVENYLHSVEICEKHHCLMMPMWAVYETGTIDWTLVAEGVVEPERRMVLDCPECTQEELTRFMCDDRNVD